MIDAVVTVTSSVALICYTTVAVVLCAVLVHSALGRALYDFVVSSIKVRTAANRACLPPSPSSFQQIAPLALPGPAPSALPLSGSAGIDVLSLAPTTASLDASQSPPPESKRAEAARVGSTASADSKVGHDEKAETLRQAVVAALAPVTDRLQAVEKRVVGPMQNLAGSATRVADSLSTVQKIAAMAFITSGVLFFADRMYKRYRGSGKTKESAISGILSATHLALAAILVVGGASLIRVWKDIGNWLSIAKTTITAWQFFSKAKVTKKHSELQEEINDTVNQLTDTVEGAVAMTKASEEPKASAVAAEAEESKESKDESKEPEKVFKQSGCRCTTSHNWQKRLHVHTYWGITVDEGLSNDVLPETVGVDGDNLDQEAIISAYRERFTFRRRTIKCDLSDCDPFNVYYGKEKVASLFISSALTDVEAVQVYMLIRLARELGFVRGQLALREVKGLELTMKKPTSSIPWNRLGEVNACNVAALLSTVKPSQVNTVAVSKDEATGEPQVDQRSFWEKFPEAAKSFWGAPLPTREDDPAAVQYLAKVGAGKLLVIIIVAAALAIVLIRWAAPNKKRRSRQKKPEKEAAPERKKKETELQQKMNQKRPKAGEWCYAWIRGVECQLKNCKFNHKGTEDDRKKVRALLGRYPCKWLDKCKVKGCAYQHERKKETSDDEDNAPEPDDAERRATLYAARGKMRIYSRPDEVRARRAQRSDDFEKEGWLARHLVGDETWDLSMRQAYDKRIGCYHAPDCPLAKKGTPVASSGGQACFRKCNGHHCVHWSGCVPAWGPPVEDGIPAWKQPYAVRSGETKQGEVKDKEGVFAIPRLDPSVPRAHTYLFWQGGQLITHFAHVQNQFVTPGHFFAPDDVTDWRKWEANTAPFQVEGKYTFSSLATGKVYSDVPLTWHVYPYADLAWADVQKLNLGAGMTIGQVVKPTFAYMVSANPSSTVDHVNEAFSITKNIYLDPAGRHDAATVPSTCGALLVGESGRALAMHMELTSTCNRAVLLWNWRAVLGVAWKDGKPTHERIVA